MTPSGRVPPTQRPRWGNPAGIFRMLPDRPNSVWRSKRRIPAPSDRRWLIGAAGELGWLTLGFAASGVIVMVPSILNEKRPVSDEESHGTCLPLVCRMTSLRTSIIRSESDRPGFSMLARNAPVNGLLRPVPSCATLSGCVANAMNVPDAVCMRLRPRPSAEDDRVPSVRDRSFANGLSRQASRITMLTRLPRPSCCITSGTGISAISSSASYSTLASVGTR